MNQQSKGYFEKLITSEQWGKVEDIAWGLDGRSNCCQMLAEQLQDLCPAVLCLTVTPEMCAKYEHKCGLDFIEIAQCVFDYIHLNEDL